MTLTQRQGVSLVHEPQPGSPGAREAPVADRAAGHPRRHDGSRHPALPHRGLDARSPALGGRISPYGPADLATLIRIGRLRGLGFKVEQIRAILSPDESTDLGAAL